jgi:DNA repair exonuclease SbcCD nuclease subunit
MKLMHIADCHVGCRMYGMQQREEDFYEALRKVGDIAEKECVDAVVIAGDLFDMARPPAKAVCEVAQFVEKLKANNIPVLGIEGNHDLTQDNYWLRTCGIWPLQAYSYYDSVKNVKVAGFNFARTDELFEQLNAFANSCEESCETWPVVALHLGLAEMGCGFNPDASAMQLVPILKKIGCKYLALGHIHIRMEQFFDGISFVQPGSLELKSIDEPQEKSVEIVNIDSDGTVTQRQVPYATRKVVHVNVNSEDDMENAAMAAKSVKDEDAMAVVYVDKSVIDGVKRVSELFSGCMARILPVGATDSVINGYERGKAMDVLKDAVLSYFDDGSAQYDMIMKIISTGDPRSVVEDFLNKEEKNEADSENVA